ncbi:MAG TPA: hypothetical protein VD906_10080, partial [Caulobacteraceae bacterium]|nr:hypothetical protein [Caulobacteraceae bacterium]
AGLNYESEGATIADRFAAHAPHAPGQLDAWLAWRREHPNGLDLIDAFYLDQRIGGWLAAAEQSIDFTGALSFQPASSAAALDALLSPPQADRAESRLQMAVIRQLAPGLLKFPMNQKTWPTRVRAQMLRPARAVRRLVRTHMAAQ